MTRTLRILSWNIAHTTEAWRRIGELGADVALLQEAVPPPDGYGDLSYVAPPSSDWRCTVRGVRSFATTVVRLDDRLRFEPVATVPLDEVAGDSIGTSHPGQFAIARLGLDGLSVTVVSLYGVWERQTGVGIYAEASLHRALSDLTPLLQQRSPLVIAGDLNIFRGYTLDGEAYWRPRYESVFDRLAAYDVDFVGPRGTGALDNCRCGGAECDHVRTYRHQRKVDSRPDQLDFVFANGAARKLLQDCQVVATDETWAVSDHAPILTTLVTG